jgi:hypothetical protein
MTPRPILLALAVSLAPACGGGGDGGTTPTPQSTAFAGTPYPATPLLPNGLRNKYKWPFASDSIWNVPIGSGARYVPAGIAGAHGASGMSSIGGTVRVGELVPGGVIRHALKVNVFGHRNYHFDSREATPGYRWPARSADGYAGDPKNACAYGGRVGAMRVGSLVALKPDFPIETSVKADCADAGRECQWAKDMAKVFTALHVVDNNAPGSIWFGRGRAGDVP